MARNVEELIEGTRRKVFDLSKDEDLSLAIMNLVSLEEHAFFTAQKTGKSEYLDLLQELRDKRTELLALIVTQPEGETWCMSKHLLSTSMRLIETGNKFHRQDPERSQALYHHAFDCYALFWKLNQDTESAPTRSRRAEKRVGSSGMLARARSWVKEAIDCCIEK